MATSTQPTAVTQNRLKAMSHPLRLRIFRILTERTASPAEMARELDADVPAVSHHAKYLVKLGCAELVRIAPASGSGAMEHFYRATERHMVDAADWAEFDPLLAHGLIGDVLRGMRDDAAKAAAGGMLEPSNEDIHLTRTRLVLDDEGMRDALEVHEQTRLRLIEVQAQSAARLAKGKGEGRQVSTWQGCFEVPAGDGPFPST